MPGSEAATTDGASELIDSLAAGETPTIGDAKLRNEWRQLVLDVRSSRLETDVEERFARDNFERAIELALRHPESMSISTEPFERRHDLTSHLRGHFENLLNDSDWVTEFKTARPDVEYLLKICELVYLYDSVHRFNVETIVRPDLNGLEDLAFVEYSAELSEWMGEIDLLWLTLANELEPEEPIREWIDRLYDDRDDFVAEAKEREIFLPIHAEYLDDLEGTETTVEKRLSRNADIAPRLIHDYCFTRAVDRFE